MKQSHLLAIDPGASGGFAWLDSDGNPQCRNMPKTHGEIRDCIVHLASEVGCNTVIIEEVGGFAGVGQPGSAMFKFGFNTGFLHGCLMSYNFKIIMVRPQKWQKHFSLGTARDAGGKSDWKRKLKSEAERRFPTCEVTLSTADALLLLEYGRETMK